MARSPYDSSPRRLSEFGPILQPDQACEPILARPVRGALMEWIEEIWAKDDLSAVGLAPRRRALFTGKPGIGKTTLAHHLAARLGLPMLAVGPDRIVSKWVGASAENVGDLFDLLEKEKRPLLLFFDEFDSLGFSRSSGSSGSDRNAREMVNILLQRMEAYQGILIAATNHGRAIDSAIWRRFEIQIELELPGQEERERILERYLAPYGLPTPALQSLARAFETASPALMRQFAEGLKRQLVLGPRLKWDMRKAPVIARILAAVQPHPDFGKPRLWAHGADDAAVAMLPWPLPFASDLPASPAEEPSNTVVPLRKVPA